MSEFLPFIVIGLASGAVYGLAGMGVVLTYKTSGILPFGYGSIAALGAFLFYFLHVEQHWAWPLAAAICIGGLAPLLGLLLELLARSLGDASETIKVVGMVGVIVFVESIGYLWHETNSPTYPQFLPQSTTRILGVNVTWAEIIIFTISLVASVSLYWFFRVTRTGAVMRGVVDNHDLVSMCGDDPIKVRRSAWIIGSAFACAAGLLLSPALPVDGVTLPTLVFSAFGAAAIGYFTNLPLTFAGGLALGIASSLLDKYAATISWLAGLPSGLPFVVLIAVLILARRDRLVQGGLVAVQRARRSYHAPVRVRLAVGAIVVGLLAAIPAIQANYVAVWSGALIYMILFLSLGLLVRKSGQISLCQLAFAAVGATTFGHFMAAGIPWLASLILATLVAAPVGALIAIPAVRVSGVFLALATLGFGTLMSGVFYNTEYMFGTNELGILDPRPHFSIGGWNLSTNTGFYFLLLVIAVIVVLAVTAIGNGRLGRLLSALSDSPLALETHGTDSAVLKVVVFSISASIASLAGALTGMLYIYAVSSYFPPFNSLTLVAIVVIIVVGEPWYAVLGAIGFTVIPGYVTGTSTSTWLTLLFGVTAMTAAYGTRGFTTPDVLRRFIDRLGGRKLESKAAPPVAQKVRPGAAGTVPISIEPSKRDGLTEALRTRGDHQGLAVRNVSVEFGGIRAVNDVDLDAEMGTITGLVGPNGAGKTTLFNVCSGLTRPDTGRVLLHGVDISRKGPATRARLGLGRTFQRVQLFDNLTVRQNVAMGREASFAGRNPIDHLFGSSRASRVVAAAVDEALEIVGITRISSEQAGLLPIGQKRLVELARALAGRFDMLLLDEPSSGLDNHETEQFAQVLNSVIAERNCGILLVEHDMGFVHDVCKSVYVLDFGKVIFTGTTEGMVRSQKVRAAYLGEVSYAESPASDADVPVPNL